MNAPAEAFSASALFESERDRAAPPPDPREARGRQLRLLQIALPAFVLVAACAVAPRLAEHHSDAMTYGPWGLAMLAGGIASLLCGTQAEAGMKLRWRLLGIALCGGSMGYLMAAVVQLFPAAGDVLNPLRMAISTGGSAAMMLALTMASAAPGTARRRSIVALDIAQTAIFIALSYTVNAGSNPWARDVQAHVVISMTLAAIMFATAAVAPLSAGTTEERRFFKVVAIYLLAALVARFVSSQVGYLWMHAEGNLYDIPAIGVCVGMAVFLMENLRRSLAPRAPDCDLGPRRLMVRNLMPSLLAFTSLMIALYIFLHAPVPGLLAVLCVVVLYVSRTMLLQTHMGVDAAALRCRNEQLLLISERDPLTGAGNRRSLATCYERECKAASEAGGDPRMTLLLIDLDWFKQANDRLGHLHGDNVLAAVAVTLRTVASAVPCSHVARFGGDEFAVLLPAVSAKTAAELSEAIRDGVAALALDAGSRTISVSIGGAFSEQALPLEASIARADIALYNAKSSGRNRVVFEFVDSASDEAAEAATTALWQSERPDPTVMNSPLKRSLKRSPSACATSQGLR